jgi:hexosaminidase
MKNKTLIFLLAILILAACNSKTEQSGAVKIIPNPVEVISEPGYFIINSATAMVVPDEFPELSEADILSDLIRRSAGYNIEVKTDGASRNAIRFEKVQDIKGGPEGYELIVEKNGVKIRAGSEAGFFYGIQTLIQLLPPEVFSRDINQQDWKIPCCTIVDHPRFSWRGMHLDVSRHFFPVSFIKRYIDLIAMHKMNVFHWHLTDDNGWRIEIKKYPELAKKAAWRVDREDEPWRERTAPEPGERATYGGYYTQEQILEIVEYAKRRHVMVLPEIEMPGHTSEVFAAFPELSCRGEPLHVQPGSYWPNVDIFCAGKEETFAFIEGVLEEVFELFPSEYVHIGGDEATKTRWQNCRLCQKRIRDEGLANEEELQSWFIRRVESFLKENNKRLIGWDEILEGGLAPDATVMSWRGIKGGIEAAEMGHDVIMCPTSHCYFDYYQAHPDFEPEAIGGFTSLKEVYLFEPIPSQLDGSQAKHILGGQGNVWTEYIATPEHAEYMAVPRMTALAEVLWSPKDLRDWEHFQDRLQMQKSRFDHLGVNYSNGSWKVNIQPVMKEGVYHLSLSSEQYGKPIRYTLDGKVPDIESSVYEKPVRISGSTVVTAALFNDGQAMEYPNRMEVVYHLATGKNIELKHSPALRYRASGPLSLIDGIKGTEDFHDGYWMGFEGSDVVAEIDLGKSFPIYSVVVGFLQNTGSWIFLPEKVTFTLLSEDRKVVLERIVTPDVTWEVKGTIIEDFELEFDSMDARYIRLHAPGLETIPSWHEGAGEKGWLFVDEVIIHGPG